MENTEAIIYLAKQEAKRFKRYKYLDQVNKELPYFVIQKNSFGKYETTGYNYQGHDNADRMGFIIQVLKAFVFPNVTKEADLSGYYNIELHDSYTYLNNGKNYKNCLTWSRSKDDKTGVLLPDQYQIANYRGVLSIPDQVEWSKKQDQIAFFGTTTGSRDPKENERIKTCIWSLKNRALFDFNITKVAQIEPAKIMEAWPNFPAIYKDPVPPEEIHKYKFNLDIPGNTCSWDRVPLVLNSQSLLFKLPCNDMCWYYPLLQSGREFVNVTLDNLESNYHYFANNTNHVKFLTMNANQFVKDYLQQAHASLYMTRLFEEAEV